MKRNNGPTLRLEEGQRPIIQDLPQGVGGIGSLLKGLPLGKGGNGSTLQIFHEEAKLDYKTIRRMTAVSVAIKCYLLPH